jgi:hypothetical protein
MPQNPVIPQPVSSGATDHPDAVQSGTPQAPPVPEGFGDQQGPSVPEGFSDTPPVQNTGDEKKSTSFGQDDPTGMSELAVGAAKGLGKTVATVGGFLNRAAHPENNFQPTGDKIDVGLKKLDEWSSDPKGLAEHAGTLLEGIGEFVLGDEALKSLNLAERLGIAQKITDIGMKYPFVAKILGHGIQSIRQGVAAGGQQMLHGASPEDAAVTAGTSAGLGTLVGAGVEGAGKAITSVKNTLQTAARTPQELQPEFQQGVKDLVDQVADEHGVAKSKSKTMATYVQETADNVEEKARKIYQKIDQATGENFFQRIEQKLDNTKRAIRNLNGTEDDVAQEAKLEKARTELMDASDQMWEKAKLKGVTRADYDEAVNTWKQAQALYDLDTELNRPNIISGLRPDIGTAAQSAANPETVDPSNFFKRINKMYKSGRLQEAVGDDRAKNFLTHTSGTMSKESQLLDEAAKAQQTIKRVKQGAVIGATAIGAGAIGRMGAGALVDSVQK